MAKQIKIFDTTLRDGEQSPGCSMNISEKLKMAAQLEALGVDIIEAGFASSSPGDFVAVKSISGVVKNAVVASLARATKEDINTAYEAVREANHPRLHVFLATSDIHMEYKLKMTREQVLKQVSDMVAYACSLCGDVEFSAEDASRSDPDFLCRVVEAAIEAGAGTINIPDTVGYAAPGEFSSLIKKVATEAKGIENVVLSVHCHDDLGLATANSLAAIEAGATQVECTVNGIGERAGNTSLEEIVMVLATRRNVYDSVCNIDTTQIYKTSKLLSTITGVKVQPNKAIVGENAFAHEAGIHQHGVLVNPLTYEIMTPASIGLTDNRMVLGKHSGKHALRDRLSSMGYTVSDDELTSVFAEFKELADRQKDVSDWDIEALVERRELAAPEYYKVSNFVINAGNNITTTSSVRLTDADGSDHEAVVASKFGPIDASYSAINQIMKGENFELTYFNIAAVTGGTDSQGAVTVKIESDGKVFNGHGISLDIIDAAINAYVAAINSMMYDRSLVSGGSAAV